MIHCEYQWASDLNRAFRSEQGGLDRSGPGGDLCRRRSCGSTGWPVAGGYRCFWRPVKSQVQGKEAA